MLRRCTLRACATRLPKSAYVNRHIGPTDAQLSAMVGTITGGKTTDVNAFVKSVVPADIQRAPMPFVAPLSEHEALADLRATMSKNRVGIKSLIGQGYYEALVPPVIQRNVLESPGWYTPYTPYQAEISQGRLESLLNYQTVITELTKMDFANASLLDQATAGCEGMNAAFVAHRKKRTKFFVDRRVFVSTSSMVLTRAEPLGIEVVVGDLRDCDMADPTLCGVLVQTPDAEGTLHDFSDVFAAAHANGVICVLGTDLLALTVTKTPGEMGADIAYGNAQRFGVPLGYGGPHPAFFAVKDQFKRSMPGRLIGVSRDAQGKRALRMALQTREQHIKREHATSNICTAQALLANMAAMYAVYHGPEGLKEIAQRVHGLAKTFAAGLESTGHELRSNTFFDTVTFTVKSSQDFVARCEQRKVNVWPVNATTVSVSFDEATTEEHLKALLEAAGLKQPELATLTTLAAAKDAIPANVARTSPFLTQPVFSAHHNETSMMRYIYGLQLKDFGLVHGMIPLGSCTMKLNAAATMLPMSWAEVGNLHPLVPESQAEGYRQMALGLEAKLREVTGFAAISLQPNSGAQGEYAGLRVIREYHRSQGQGHRNVCLIPANAHGTNPASAIFVGMQIVTVKCLPNGLIDMTHLRELCGKHEKNLSAIMVTYPSTYGIFDNNIKEITQLIHEKGGQVYIDGANLNAMVGHTGPGFFGGDVCHINLHKTFSIPHGGGGPGMGPIGVREHLAPFLPNSSRGGAQVGGSKAFGQVSQAAYGSASILNISYLEMGMLGSEGLTKATSAAIVSANYLASKLCGAYDILYRDPNGRVAHEFILDLRKFKKTCEIEAEDVAKRLMDYGFHAPTLSFPVPGTLMVEPTESEPIAELDRFVEAMLSIRAEIADIESGKQPRQDNVLKNAPHTHEVVVADSWSRPYTREVAAYPVPTLRANKFWPTVGRIEGAYGDTHLFCSCS